MTSTGPVPLTTIFTQSSNCRNVTSSLEYVDGTNYISTFSATDASGWMSLGPEDWSTCYPSGYDTQSYFSPGECPSGYTTAGVSFFSLGNEVETRAICCPSGYNAQTGESLPWYSTNPCTSSNTDIPATASFTIDGVETSSVGTFGINAKGISIRRQSTDFASATCTGISSPTSSGNGTYPVPAVPAVDYHPEQRLVLESGLRWE
ncbi:hypothetical protein N7493_008646 [Penicillium malachiteum]|uniref:Uncharacterized protein n=1 Tax=Penicillium malachiteum TaxID=1324776 RepID=A0AAD6HHP1_9EURO|nr:hypothetical protein N7493_008646 [Penicillium malachiteum]